MDVCFPPDSYSKGLNTGTLSLRNTIFNVISEFSDVHMMPQDEGIFSYFISPQLGCKKFRILQ